MQQPSLTLHRKSKKSSRRSRKHLQDIDEALWTAYRKYDRATVMEKLVERFLLKAKPAVA
jgi:hypothetical protein